MPVCKHGLCRGATLNRNMWLITSKRRGKLLSFSSHASIPIERWERRWGRASVLAKEWGWAREKWLHSPRQRWEEVETIFHHITSCPGKEHCVLNHTHWSRDGQPQAPPTHLRVISEHCTCWDPVLSLSGVWHSCSPKDGVFVLVPCVGYRLEQNWVKTQVLLRQVTHLPFCPLPAILCLSNRCKIQLLYTWIVKVCQDFQTTFYIVNKIQWWHHQFWFISSIHTETAIFRLVQVKILNWKTGLPFLYGDFFHYFGPSSPYRNFQ